MKNLMKMLPKNPAYLVLSLLMAVFIVMDISPPNNICMLVDTMVGKAVVIMVALSLFSLDKSKKINLDPKKSAICSAVFRTES